MLFNLSNTWLGKSDSVATKSNGLGPLLWMFGLLLVATVNSSIFSGPSVLTWILLCMLILVFISLLCVYFYCLVKSPDMLRSEKFVINKMALNMGVYGDNTSFNPDGVKKIESQLNQPDKRFYAQRSSKK